MIPTIGLMIAAYIAKGGRKHGCPPDFDGRQGRWKIRPLRTAPCRGSEPKVSINLAPAQRLLIILAVLAALVGCTASSYKYPPKVRAFLRQQWSELDRMTTSLLLARNRYERHQRQEDLDEGIKLLRGRAASLKVAIKEVTFEEWACVDRIRVLKMLVNEWDWAERSAELIYSSA